MFEIAEKQTIKQTEDFVKNLLGNDSSGHDWWHVHRVRNLAMKISETEGGDRFIIELAALLHDVDDWKTGGDEKYGKTREWLNKINLQEDIVEKIIEVIDQVSFKGANVKTVVTSKESEIVQDADRLDAIGAIGIARTFSYGGKKGRLIYAPEVKPELHDDFESYKNSSSPTINHFFEKLLLLKNLLNTPTAIEIAKKRHIFMEQFLEQFFREWKNVL